MKKLWLVDVDGTVLDKSLVWKQLNQKFAEKFPRIRINFREYYDTHKGELHSVDLVKEIMKAEHGVNEAEFKQVFEEVNYSECFDHDGWQRLSGTAKQQGMELAFFTQGTRWVQEAKQKQIKEIVGDLPWHIYEGDKMAELRGLMDTYQKKGMEICGLVDDMAINRKRAEAEQGLSVVERL